MSTYLIKHSDGRFLTGIQPGKSRRGWSKYLDKAARFDTYEVAKWTRERCLGKQRDGATIEEVKL